MSLALRWRILAAFGSGVTLATAYSPDNSWLTTWIALTLLLQGVLGASGRVAALCGFIQGVSFYLATVAWVHTTMRVYGGLSAPAAGGVLALMVAYLALYRVAFSVFIAWLSRKRGVGWACAAAPFAWVTLEFAQTHFPAIGFPWNLLGYAAAKHIVLLQFASVTGIWGLSLVAAGFNAMLAWALVTRARLALIVAGGIAVALVATIVVGDRWVPSAQPRSTARLVQVNFPQAMSYPGDWLDKHTAELDELERISVGDAGSPPQAGQPMAGVTAQNAVNPPLQSSQVDLIIWPEVPAPFYLQDPRFAARAQRIARGANAWFLLGVVEWRPAQSPAAATTRRQVPHNSAVLLAPTGERAYTYDKIHLVPFGEYVPARRLLRFAESLVAEVGDFERGREYSVGQTPSGKFSALICYEVVFPDLVRRFVQNGAELLVNISNDGWLGRSAGPDQHLAMARVRAVENRRWLLRSTNNGYSAAIDPYGRVVAQLPTDVRATLDVPFEARSGVTFYTRFGDWLAWLCVVLVFAFAGAGLRPARASHNAQ